MDEKQFTLDEALAVDFEGSANAAVLRCDTRPLVESVTMDEGRVVVSGSVNVMLALDVSNETEYRVKRAAFNLPFNQLIELEHANEESRPTATVTILSSGADVEEDGIVGVSLLCAVEVRAFEDGTATLITDAYSTKYELDMEREVVSVTHSVVPIWEPVSIRQTVEKRAGGAKLIDYFVVPTSTSLVTENGSAAIRVAATLSYFLCDEMGDIVCWDHDFTFDVDVDEPLGTAYSALDTVLTSVECTETNEGVSMKVEGIVVGNIINLAKLPAVKSVSFDAANVKARPDMAVSIYFADEGEDIFEIAKAFNTSPREI
jgi:hypothetical protein